jgi:hypothetical protein
MAAKIRRGSGKKFTKGQSGNPKGRPAGIPNKFTGALKDMILHALESAGGTEYLAAQAKENPSAFLTLVGKVLPLQIGGGEGMSKLVIEWQQSKSE